MRQKVGQYGRIYGQFLSNCLAYEMSFRINFVSLLVLEVVNFVVAISTIHILFNHLDRIGDWSKPEFLFFTSLVYLIDMMFLTFFAVNFWQFSDDIRTGNLDFVLTKPVSSLFLVFCRKVRVGGLASVLWAFGAVFWFGMDLPEGWTLQRISLFALFLTAAMILKVGLEILVGTLMFITVEGEAVNMFRINLQVVQKQPDFIYGMFFRTTLSLFYPLLLVTSMPGHVIFGTVASPWIVGFFFFSIIYVWFAVCLVWKWGLDRYESASS